MKAIILAAGRGSRMKEFTNDLPKCRIKLHNKELIQWQLTSLQGADIKDISLVRGYLAETFNFELTYFDNNRWNETNMVSSLKTAESWLHNDTCIVSYSDIIYSTDAVKRLKNMPGDIVITYDPKWERLWSIRFDDPLSDAETFRLDGDRIVEIGNRAKSPKEIEGQYMGLLKFTPAGWQQVTDYLKQVDQEKVDQMDMTKLLQELIAEDYKIYATPIADKWFEVDSEEDLKAYENINIDF